MFAIVLLASGLSAQPEQAARAMPPVAMPPPFYLAQSGQVFAPAALRGQEGQLRERGLETAVGWQSFAGPQHLTTVETGYRRLYYGLGERGGLAGRRSDANAVFARASLRRPWREDWTWTGLAAGSIGAFEDAEIWRGGNLLLSGGLGYSVWPGFEISGNLLVFIRPDEDLLVLPVPALLWQVNPRLRLRTANGVYVNYWLTRDRAWEMKFSGVFETRGFALQGMEGDLAAARALEERFVEWQWGIVARWSPQWSMEATLLAKTWREFKYLRASETLERLKVDSGFGGSLRLSYRF